MLWKRLTTRKEKKMSTQTTISQYFSNRKRRVDEIKSVNQDKKTLTSDVLDLPSQGQEIHGIKRKISWDSECEVPRKKVVTPGRYLPKKTPEFLALSSEAKKKRVKSAESSKARRGIFSDVPKKKVVKFDEAVSVASPTDPQPLSPEPQLSSTCDTPGPSEESSRLTVSEPAQIKGTSKSDQVVPQTPPEEVHPIEPKKHEDATLSEPQPSTSKQSSLRQELGLGSLKAKLIGSSRLDKIRDAIKRIDKGYERLAEIQKKKDGAVPTLSQFDYIEYETPCSPNKGLHKIEPIKAVPPSPSKLREAVFKSPAKVIPSIGLRRPYVSPRKLMEELRPERGPAHVNGSPVYERYCSVAAQTGKPALPLPLSYRNLAETFRDLDVVLSMMWPRKELPTFSKIRPSVQAMTKKTLTEQHLRQILSVFPQAFRIKYNKVKEQGKPPKYELTILPFPSSTDEQGEAEVNTSSSLLERKRLFYNNLLDLVKAHHEKFLLSLDPPLIVDKDKLSRWHPAFMLDSCPEIELAQIPEMPTIETVTSAKQLLGKAKEMFVVNPRMEKALEKLSQSENRTNSDGKASAASVIPAFTNALKGIPQSLLEKIRAKQAAKEAAKLTMDPQKTKEDIMLSRLPELSRILWNLYTVERKNVLLKSRVLDKLDSSFRENLSPMELDRHLLLLVEKTKPWLQIHKDGHVTYIRLDKSMDMKKVYETISPINTS